MKIVYKFTDVSRRIRPFPFGHLNSSNYLSNSATYNNFPQHAGHRVNRVSSVIGFINTCPKFQISYNSTITPFRTFSSAPEKPQPKKLLSLAPHEFEQYLKTNHLKRCFLIWSDSEQRVVASHPQLQEIEDWLNDPSNDCYRQHEAIFFSLGIRTGCLLSAFLWRINRGQAYGGIRMGPYTTMESYLNDGLRLSRRLGVKSALAGLWVGGGKGIIADHKDKLHRDPDFRSKLFYDYGDFVSSLNGCYVAGMDIGVNTYDLYNIHSRTRWVVCGPEDIGGSGNAAEYLGQGVICGIEAALNFLGSKGIAGRKVAVQGAGGVGLAVVSFIEFILV